MDGLRFAAAKVLILIAFLFPMVACGSAGPENEVRMPEKLKRFAPCPDSPNCVNSDATDSRHAIAPFRIRSDREEAWKALLEQLRSMARVTIVEENDGYVRVKAKTRIFRFVDDVEMELRANEGIIAVRSASRVGRSDLGVNRRRVEGIREALRKRGVVE